MKKQADNKTKNSKQDSKQDNTPKVEVKAISPTVLGQLRAGYDRLGKALAEQGVKSEEIDARVLQRQTEDAMTQGVSLDMFLKQLGDLKVKSAGQKIGEHKEQFRTDFDIKTNNLLHAINHSSDERVVSALSALLEHDRNFQKLTGIEQSSRNDWRGLIILSAHPKNREQLALYRGGWGDGSKQDRNQYSNGRRVPVAKTTGYALSQPEPDWTDPS